MGRLYRAIRILISLYLVMSLVITVVLASVGVIFVVFFAAQSTTTPAATPTDWAHFGGNLTQVFNNTQFPWIGFSQVALVSISFVTTWVIARLILSSSKLKSMDWEKEFDDFMARLKKALSKIELNPLA